MKTKNLWTLIVSLVILNGLTVTYFLLGDYGKTKEVSSNVEVGSELEEIVATVGDDTISRQEWLSELENRYGRQTLEDMIDEKVVRKMAEQYDVEVSEEEFERELTMFKSMYNPIDHQNMNEDQWIGQIQISLLLEELLTKDAVISEEEVKQYYEQNKDLYDIPTTYHLSHIVVGSEDEALQVIKELDNGSSFSTLAMERSVDDFTANQGGDLGYVSQDSQDVPETYVEIAKKLDVDRWSEPIKLENGYGIILLHEVSEGTTYSYDMVKNQIKRQIAIDQMSGALSVKPFWEEVKVSWFYGK